MSSLTARVARSLSWRKVSMQPSSKAQKSSSHGADEVCFTAVDVLRSAEFSSREAYVMHVLRNLCSQDKPSIQEMAVRELGALIDESTANEAQALAASIRECGALRHLLQLVDHPSSESDALRVIGI